MSTKKLYEVEQSDGSRRKYATADSAFANLHPTDVAVHEITFETPVIPNALGSNVRGKRTHDETIYDRRGIIIQ